LFLWFVAVAFAVVMSAFAMTVAVAVAVVMVVVVVVCVFTVAADEKQGGSEEGQKIFHIAVNMAMPSVFGKRRECCTLLFPGPFPEGKGRWLVAFLAEFFPLGPLIQFFLPGGATRDADGDPKKGESL